MLSIPSSIRIFICTTATDMRKQFDGLVAIVSHTFGKDVMTGDYFVFVNRAQNRCKVLCWDRDGFAVWAKRLERGRFQLPSAKDDSIVAEIDGTTLAMILGGVDLGSAKRRKRFQIEQSQPPIGDVSHNAAASNMAAAC
ncbi:MAG: IS66 family insertion sequence element accessory protein TnpB [Pirellulaceae bacterium]